MLPRRTPRPAEGWLQWKWRPASSAVSSATVGAGFVLDAGHRAGAQDEASQEEGRRMCVHGWNPEVGGIVDTARRVSVSDV